MYSVHPHNSLCEEWVMFSLCWRKSSMFLTFFSSVDLTCCLHAWVNLRVCRLYGARQFDGVRCKTEYLWGTFPMLSFLIWLWILPQINYIHCSCLGSAFYKTSLFRGVFGESRTYRCGELWPWLISVIFWCFDFSPAYARLKSDSTNSWNRDQCLVLMTVSPKVVSFYCELF